MFRQLTERVLASPQIGPEEVAEAAARGVALIINNRPDGEGGPAQPSSAAIEAAAKAAGMAYVHFPVASLMITPEQVSRYHALCADLPHPIVAFCAAGGRANALFQATGCQVGRSA